MSRFTCESAAISVRCERQSAWMRSGLGPATERRRDYTDRPHHDSDAVGFAARQSNRWGLEGANQMASR